MVPFISGVAIVELVLFNTISGEVLIFSASEKVLLQAPARKQASMELPRIPNTSRKTLCTQIHFLCAAVSHLSDGCGTAPRATGKVALWLYTGPRGTLRKESDQQEGFTLRDALDVGSGRKTILRTKTSSTPSVVQSSNHPP